MGGRVSVAIGFFGATIVTVLGSLYGGFAALLGGKADMAMTELLKIQDLSVAFPTYHGTVRAVRDVSFAIYEGKILAVVGESGCDKSVTWDYDTGWHLYESRAVAIRPVSAHNQGGCF